MKQARAFTQQLVLPADVPNRVLGKKSRWLFLDSSVNHKQIFTWDTSHNPSNSSGTPKNQIQSLSNWKRIQFQTYVFTTDSNLLLFVLCSVSNFSVIHQQVNEVNLAHEDLSALCRLSSSPAWSHTASLFFWFFLRLLLFFKPKLLSLSDSKRLLSFNLFAF